MTTTAGPTTGAITAQQVYVEAVARFGEDKVGAAELGEVYEAMQTPSGKKAGGVWYTPDPAAQAISRLCLEIVGLKQIGPEPEQVMRIIALDPACGCGIFLVHAARQLSTEYARRLIGGEPSGDLVLAVMPRVILNCVYGIELDPVAAQLARIAVSLETAGAITPDMLNRHIIAGNTPEGASPPAMDDRTGPTPLPKPVA